MGEGFIQGMQIANQMWNPYVQANLEAKRMKQKLLIERDIQQELLGRTAKGLEGLGLFKKTETKQINDPNMPIPEFKTDYGLKSPAFQTGTGQPIAPAGTNRTVPVNLIDSQGNGIQEQQLTADEIKQRLELLNGLQVGGRSTTDLGMINALTRAGQSLENMPAEVNPNSLAELQAFIPQRREVSQEVPMTADDIKALLNANMAKEFIEPQRKQQEIENKIKFVQGLGLPEEDLQNVIVGIAGGSPALNAMKLPTWAAEQQSKMDNRLWNQSFKEKQLASLVERFNRTQNERERHNIASEAYQSGMLAEFQARTGLQADKLAKDLLPTYTTEQIDPKSGNVTKVTTKGRTAQNGGQKKQDSSVSQKTSSYQELKKLFKRLKPVSYTP